MEESVGKIEHIATNFLRDSMIGDVEETDSSTRVVYLTGHFLTICEGRGE